MGERRERPGWAYCALFAGLTFALLFWLWILLVGELDLEDALAGVVAAAAGTGAGWAATHAGRALPQLRRRDAARLARAVPALFTETVAVYGAAARHALGRPIGAATRTVPTDAAGGGWAAARRSSVVGALESLTPGRIVIDIDHESGDAVVHELRARP